MTTQSGTQTHDRTILFAHKTNDFLETVLCFFRGEYVIWVHNTQTDGYGTGHYFGLDQKAAIEAYLKRLKENENHPHYA